MSGNYKVLITGSKGMLGSNILKNLSFDKKVAFSSSKLDVSNYEMVQKILLLEKPDIIIHTAAFTDVENCEKNPDKTYAINTIGTQNLVNYCISKDVLFIYISSTGIYGKHKNSAYDEFDDVMPTTIHHKSKYEAEKNVLNHLNKYIILRTGWLFGGNIKHKKNFVYQRYLEAKNRISINSNAIQIGNPTSIDDFVKQMEILIREKQYGLFNCVNKAENISRYDYVKKIIELFDLPCIVKKVHADNFKREAKVSHNESAVNYKLDLLGLNIMQSWNKSLKDYVYKLKKEI